MLSGLHLVRGRVLVVVAPGDTAAKAAVETYLYTVPRGAATVVSPESLAKAAPDSYGIVSVFSSSASQYFLLDMTILAQCLEKLRPGGHVIARLGGLSDTQASQLDNTALFAGAVESKVGEKVPAKTSGLLNVEFSCTKPSWAAGAATALPGFSFGEQINEDDLLGEVPAPVGKGKSDCSSMPKACANCSCGRKELEDKHGADEAKKKLEQGTVRSACNSCYLGDAFRCDSCPYRGTPAFKPGTKVELSSGDTEGTGQLDAREQSTGDQALAAKDGKMVLNLA